MKKALLLILTLTIATAAHAAIGDWKIYMAYSEPQQIERVGEQLFVRASNSLYIYDKTDQSLRTFDKTTGLSDVTITNIAWNATTKRLVIVYDNSNIDLIDLDGNITNIPDLYNKSMTDDKTINGITMSGPYAYLATNFGGVKLDLSRIEISESYILGLQVTKIGIDNTHIYALTSKKQAYKGSLASNLIDKSNWALTTTYPTNIFATDTSAYNENIDLVKSLQPGGPKSNLFGFMKFKNGTLYTCSGTDWANEKPAAIQLLKDGEWNIYKDDYIAEKTGQKYWDMMCIDAYDNKLAACTRNGLYIFEDGMLKDFYNNSNSILESFSNSGNPDYVLITSVTYDNKGNLWILNSGAPTQSIIEYKADGTFKEHKQPGLMVFEDRGQMKSAQKMVGANITSDNQLWFSNSNWVHPAAFRYDIDNDKLYDYSNFVNQDMTTIANLWSVNAVVEDKTNNEFLVATDAGLLFLPQNYLNDPSNGFIQFKVPRNDGTNLADYLLTGINITCIAIDGGGRKWIGTNGAGLFVISQDKLTQVMHLEQSNSKLLSNNILSIAIDGDKGEIYIGTDKGLCSYQSDVSTPNEVMTSDNVYAYPNPVEPNYTGLITVVGLSNNSDVKILSSNGSIIAEGRSNGGTFTWDGKDSRGRRVASGIYMVATATSDGDKGTVCKIAVIN